MKRKTQRALAETRKQRLAVGSPWFRVSGVRLPQAIGNYSSLPPVFRPPFSGFWMVGVLSEAGGESS